MTRSIISNDKKCIVCEDVYVHKHHIYEGTANRKKSEQDGCWCYLCPKHHNMSNEGIHYNRDFNEKMKKECQRRWEEIYGSREDFIRRYGRSYL